MISEKDFLIKKGVFSFAGYLNPFLQKFPHLDISVDSQVQNHVPSSLQGGDGGDPSQHSGDGDKNIVGHDSGKCQWDVTWITQLFANEHML